MSVRRALLVAACLVMPVSNAALAQSFEDEPCWRPEEAAAARVQTVQTMLMVQALKCQDTMAASVDGYNLFLQRKRDLIVATKRIVEGHFVRSLGAVAGANEATNFQTRLGNLTSSDEIDPERCRQAAAYARLASNASDEDLQDLAALIAPMQRLYTCARSEPAGPTPAAMVIPSWRGSALPAPPALEKAPAPAALEKAPDEPAETVAWNGATGALQPAPEEAAPAEDAVQAVAATDRTPAKAAPTAPADTPATTKADQVKALQAAVAALNQVAASLATETASTK